MHVLIVPDKFKGSLTAAQAATTIRDTLLTLHPTWSITVMPVADGGEGTASLLTRATNGTYLTHTVADPLGRPVAAGYGISGNGRTAFVELAEASGLHRLNAPERNPLLTSTFGTGELIREALLRGVRELVLCIGGSATTDGGIGLAAALGYRFLDENGHSLLPVGASLTRIARIDDTAVLPALCQLRVRVACDVVNPLFGPTGAAQVYGPQKGATAEAVEQLDAGLRNLADVVDKQWGRAVADEPGTVRRRDGAAGGAGYGARVFLNAQLEPGFGLVSHYLHLAERVAEADLIITGEGCLDAQTLSGKVIRGVVDLARKKDVSVVAFCGRLELSPDQVRTLGLQAAIAITPVDMPFVEAVSQAEKLLGAAVRGYFGE